MKNYTQKEAQHLLIAALKSGKYKQGRGFLHTVEMIDGKKDVHRFCCLGVATDLYQKHVGGLKEETWKSCVGYDKQFKLAPPQVVDWLGLRSSDGLYDDGANRLTISNDRGVSFARLAHAMETTPEKIFSTAEAH